MSPIGDPLYPDTLYPSDGLFPAFSGALHNEIGNDLYEALRPIADPYDEARGYPLYTWASAIGSMFHPAWDIIKDPDILLDPTRTPTSWLLWLSQFVGQNISQRAPGEAESTYRARVIPDIQNPPSARRGTVPAIVEEVQRFLQDPKTVIATERVGGNWKVGTIAIVLGQRSPGVSVAQIQTRVDEIKPAGSSITVSEVTGVDWQTLKDTHVDWTDVRTQFANWQQVFENPGLT